MNRQDKKTKKKRRPKPGDIASLRRVLWSAIRQVEGLLETDDADTTLKAVSALSTVSGVYLKCVAEHDFEARIAALEEAQAAGKSASYPRAA